jgi:hypothetical protein
MDQYLFLGLFLVGSILLLFVAFVLYQLRTLVWLKRHGRRIVATITSIRRETGKTSFGPPRDNYAVTAQWTNPRTGRTYTFWTWIMEGRPAYTQGSLVSILIDPGNPKRYIMEL